jgi:hypothetical protein
MEGELEDDKPNSPHDCRSGLRVALVFNPPSTPTVPTGIAAHP